MKIITPSVECRIRSVAHDCSILYSRFVKTARQVSPRACYECGVPYSEMMAAGYRAMLDRKYSSAKVFFAKSLRFKKIFSRQADLLPEEAGRELLKAVRKGLTDTKFKGVKKTRETAALIGKSMTEFKGEVRYLGDGARGRCLSNAFANVGGSVKACVGFLLTEGTFYPHVFNYDKASGTIIEHTPFFGKKEFREKRSKGLVRYFGLESRLKSAPAKFPRAMFPPEIWELLSTHKQERKA